MRGGRDDGSAQAGLSPAKRKLPVLRCRIDILGGEANQDLLWVVGMFGDGVSHTGDESLRHELSTGVVSRRGIHWNAIHDCDFQVIFLTVVLNRRLKSPAWEIADGNKINIAPFRFGRQRH